MAILRPVRPEAARRLLASTLRWFDAATLEGFTPAWTRPGSRH
jgi:hypothetical protein